MVGSFSLRNTRPTTRVPSTYIPVQYADEPGATDFRVTFMANSCRKKGVSHQICQ